MLIGQTIGNYLVQQKLGEGGMGSVYLAVHPQIGKKVALKVLHAEFANNPEVVERFFNEAKAVNDIGHPNIVDIVDYGMLQHGTTQLVYFIMEYIAGSTLSGMLRDERGPLPPERALGIALQVADALSASHARGIVHRDLKPDNIILSQRARQNDFVKLLDFGIAKLSSNNAAGSQHRTRTGIVMGTPAYMSPEQCEGRASVDHRTDIYALGVVLYEMLTGRVPFIGEGYGEILVQHLTQVPVPPSQYRMMPPHVEIVVLKALEKRVELRFPTMDEFMRAMADPVGYVEANGGIGGFLQRPLTPSSAPVNVRLTPPPGLGGMTGLTPIPGSLTYTTPTPTTLGQATGVGNAVPQKRGKGLFIGIGIGVVAVAGVAIAVVLGGSKGNDNPVVATGSGAAPAGSNAAVVTPPPPQGSNGSATQMTVKQPDPPPKQPDGSAGSTGSATTPTTTGSGGSAAPALDTQNIMLTIETQPPGAKIIINGFDIGKTTNATIPIPRAKDSKAAIVLQLHGYADEKLDIDAGSTNPTQTVTRNLRKVVRPTGPIVTNPPGKGSGGTPPGKGSNTGHTETGTGLMKPGD